MIIFLYGPNSYLRSKKLKEILAEYGSRLGNLLLERYDFESDDEAFNKFKSFISGRSMFDSKKFAVVDNVFELKEKKELKKIFEDILSDKETIVIAVSDTKAPASFSFLLEKPVVSQEFPAIKKGAELNSFITKEVAVRGMKLTTDQVSDLSDVFGGDLWAIATELDKMRLSSKIAIPRAPNEDYFKLINTIKSGYDVKSRLSALEIILSDRGDEPAKVFNMLCYGFNSPELIKKLADYDVMIKSGRLEYEEALLEIALR